MEAFHQHDGLLRDFVEDKEKVHTFHGDMLHGYQIKTLLSEFGFVVVPLDNSAPYEVYMTFRLLTRKEKAEFDRVMSSQPKINKEH
jgi:hypothetical protein